MNYNFGEKKEEFFKGEMLPVWESPKYAETKKKAIEIIESGKYDLECGDFWILMNSTKNKKMAYTGLIISHNACLKINDRLDSKFKPSCVSIDKEGFGESLVYTYMNDEQGIYEVGEVSKSNCQNTYPYAMAYKRLFDRVVLKLSKLAYSGVYSESESDEFKQRYDEPVRDSERESRISNLEKSLKNYRSASGDTVDIGKLCKKYGVSKLSELSDENVEAIEKLINR